MYSCITLSPTFICNMGLMHLITDISVNGHHCVKENGIWSDTDKWDTRTDEYCIVWVYKQTEVMSTLQTAVQYRQITHLKLLHDEACSVIICWEAFWNINSICTLIDNIHGTWLKYRNSSFIILQQKYHAYTLCCEYFCFIYLPMSFNTSLTFISLSYCNVTVALLFPQLYILAGSFKGCMTRYQDIRS